MRFIFQYWERLVPSLSWLCLGCWVNVCVLTNLSLSCLDDHSTWATGKMLPLWSTWSSCCWMPWCGGGRWHSNSQKKVSGWIIFNLLLAVAISIPSLLFFIFEFYLILPDISSKLFCFMNSSWTYGSYENICNMIWRFSTLHLRLTLNVCWMILYFSVSLLAMIFSPICQHWKSGRYVTGMILVPFLSRCKAILWQFTISSLRSQL